MKTRIFLSVATFAFSISAWSYNGQQSASDITDVHSYWGAAGAYYYLPLASLNAHLHDQGFTTGFTNAMAVGLDRGGEATSAKLNLPVVTYLAFHYLLPQELTSATGDKMKLNGYNFQFDFMGFNYLNNQNVTLTGGLAWAFGRLKATENTAAGTTTFLDKYFGPQARIEFNARLGDHFYIGARASYRHDFTKSVWSRTGVASTPDLPATIMDGTMVGAFIGYGK